MRTAVPMLLLALAGCQETDPYARAGMWQPGGINNRNVAAMVARPRDLVRGHGDAGANSELSALAVTRLQLGVPRPLLSLSVDAAPASGAVAAPAPAPASAR